MNLMCRHPHQAFTNRRELTMKKSIWKSGNCLDSVMNVLLIVLALGMLGSGAWEVDAQQARSAVSQRTLAPPLDSGTA